MPPLDKAANKANFETGDTPSELNFIDLIDSYQDVPAEGGFVDGDKTKLDGIETGATADQTGAEIKTAYENEANTNAFTDVEQSKLAGIEAGATGDQTGAEIKTAYENEANTNPFTDALQTKLNGIEAGATADQTGAEIRDTIDIQNAVDRTAFESGDKLLIWEAGVGNRKIDFDDIPSGGTNWGDPVNADIVPDGDDTRGLGSLAAQFSNTYTVNLWLNGVEFTAQTLADPGTDSLVFWDQSASATTYIQTLEGLSISGTTLTVTGDVGNAFAASVLNLGHASDTTLARTAAGRMTIEGAEAVRSSTSQGGASTSVVQNVVSCTTAQYGALTPNATTLYIITDAT